MAKRSWRNFDYVLLGALLLLSAYGITMIYSATINTSGVETAVRRQATFVFVGLAVLLVLASLDYRLLEIAQHPLALLTPVVLGSMSLAIVVTWAAKTSPSGISASTDPMSMTALLLPNIAPTMGGLVLVAAVFVLDRIWMEKIDLVQMRIVAALLLVCAAGATTWLLGQTDGGSPLSWEAGRFSELMPYPLVGGLAVLYMLDCLTLRFTDMLRNPLYVVMLALLGITFVVGQVAGGAQRWLGAGTVQPSELAKILTIVVLAKFLADREEELERFGTVLISLCLISAPLLLIYAQPDLGTALTLLAIWGAMVWMARIRFRHLLSLVAGGLIVLPLLWFGLEDYMRHRILLFLDPGSDPDSYFNVHQALVSIGSGGWTGKGLTHGTQSQLHFLRVRHTDFIFAVTAEELGFLGAIAMLALLFAVLWRILRVADRSKDTLGRLIATGVAAMVLFQTLVNVGMNLGLMPVTGIPLPFVSYGGSSYMTLIASMGLVESVAMRRRKLEFD